MFYFKTSCQNMFLNYLYPFYPLQPLNNNFAFTKNTSGNKNYLRIIFQDKTTKLIVYNYIYFIPFFESLLSFEKIPFQEEITPDGNIINVKTIELDTTREEFEQIFQYISLLPSITYIKGKVLTLDEINELTIKEAVTIPKLLIQKNFDQLLNLNDSHLTNLFHLASILGIYPLIKVFLNIIAIKVYLRILNPQLKDRHDLKGKENFLNFLDFLKDNFQEIEKNPYFLQFNIFPYYYDQFKTYIYLYHLGKNNYIYFSLQEFIQSNPKSKYGFEEFFSEKHGFEDILYEIDNQDITSLSGIEIIPKNINFLSLANNHILDPTTDFFKEKSPFKNFKKIFSLFLDNNLLIDLPTEFFQGLNLLSNLSLEGNLIKSLNEKHFEPIKDLKSLNLSNNLLTSPNISISNLYDLEELHLNNNNLENISSTFFYNLKNLKKLYLENCKIKNIPPNLFSNLENLKILRIPFNQLKKLAENTFQGLFLLEELCLHGNDFENVQDLPFNIFKDLTNLKALTLFSTPLAEKILKIYNNDIEAATKYIRDAYNLKETVFIILKL